MNAAPVQFLTATPRRRSNGGGPGAGNESTSRGTRLHSTDRGQDADAFAESLLQRAARLRLPELFGRPRPEAVTGQHRDNRKGRPEMTRRIMQLKRASARTRVSAVEAGRRNYRASLPIAAGAALAMLIALIQAAPIQAASASGARPCPISRSRRSPIHPRRSWWGRHSRSRRRPRTRGSARRKSPSRASTLDRCRTRSLGRGTVGGARCRKAEEAPLPDGLGRAHARCPPARWDIQPARLRRRHEARRRSRRDRQLPRLGGHRLVRPSARPLPDPDPPPDPDPTFPDPDPPPSGDSSQALIQADLDTGLISYDTSLIYRTLALFGDPRLPSRYQAAPSSGEDQALFAEFEANLAVALGRGADHDRAVPVAAERPGERLGRPARDRYQGRAPRPSPRTILSRSRLISSATPAGATRIGHHREAQRTMASAYGAAPLPRRNPKASLAESRPRPMHCGGR